MRSMKLCARRGAVARLPLRCRNRSRIVARYAGLLALGTIVLAGLGSAAQKATEVFIPIGMSPGVSGISSEIGEVVSYDADTRTLIIRNDSGEHSARLTDDTDVWVDRSRAGESNAVATAVVFGVGSRCEIKYVYEGTTRRDEAEWIKIEPGQRPSP